MSFSAPLEYETATSIKGPLLIVEGVRDVGWDEVVEVRFPDGAPWVTLELDDTDELAVMAIQRADGQAGRDEAHRLARLVDRHWSARA